MPASDIARALRLPENYLSKILHALARAGVVDSERGRGGGFSLARPATRLSLAEVIEPFDELAARRHCLLGRPACSDRSPCPAHARWTAVGEQVQDFFHHTTVADLIPAPSETRTPVAARSR
jgi:Rrf2 family protein